MEEFPQLPDETEVNCIPITKVAEALDLPLKAIGAEQYIPCPLSSHEHDDRDPKCHLSDDKNLWHCFKCGKSGDVVGLVKAVRNCEAKEAYAWLRSTFNLGNPAGGHRIPTDPIESLARLRRWEVEALRNLGVTPGNGLVIFPMRDAEGNIVGRKLRRADNKPLKTQDGTEVKSLTRAGDKSGLFYPVPLPSEGSVLVCEGEADVVAALSAGYRAVVGTAGANVGSAGRKALRRLLSGRDCVLVPHPDAAGRRWLEKVGKLLLNVRCALRYIPPDADKDLDQRLRFEKGKAAMLHELVEKALPYQEKPVTGNKLHQAEILTRLCEAHVEEFVQDQFGNPYVVIPVGVRLEVWPTSSKRFREAWLAQLYRKQCGKPPASEALKQARIQAEARCFDTARRTLFNRMAKLEDKLYYDLSDDEWRAVEITPERWRIVSSPPIFRRYKHQVPQVEPVKGGNLDDLWSFFNIPEKDRRLFLALVISYLVPDIPHPILILHGEHGSGKSTVGRYMKMLVDPSAVLTHALPKDSQGLFQKLDHHWLVAFDNVSRLSYEVSDGLCRTVTGEGMEKRALYTDDEDFLRAYRRCVMLTAITNPAYGEDLLSRAILIETERLSKIVDEETLDPKWREAVPGILGYMFDVLVEAMKALPSVPRQDLPRMADFAVWGMAAAPALGFTGEEFMADYRKAIDEKWRDAVEASPFASAIVDLVDFQGGSWSGTATQLYDAITPTDDLPNKSFPKNPRGVSARLTKQAAALRAVGVNIKRPDPAGKKKEKIIVLTKETKDDELPF